MKHTVFCYNFLLCILFQLDGVLLGQGTSQFIFRNIVKQQLGLAQNSSIRDIAQDNYGFIWLATGKGLYRYDGTTFTGYFPVTDDTSSISDTEIMSLYFSNEDDQLWIGTALHGIDVYDITSDKIDRLTSFPDSLGRVWTIAGDDRGNIWAGTDYALVQIDTAGMYHAYIPHTPDSFLVIRSIIPDLETTSQLWLGTHQGLLHFTPGTGDFSQVNMPYPVQYDIADACRGLAGDIWLATHHGGLLHFDPVHQQWEQFDVGESSISKHEDEPRAVYSLAVLDSATLLFTAFNGPGMFDVTRRSFQMFEKDSDNPHKLYPTESYRSLYTCTPQLVVIGGTDILSIAFADRAASRLQYAPVIESIYSQGVSLETASNAIITKHVILADDQRDLSITLTIPEFVTPEDVQYRFRLDGHDQDWIKSGTSRLARYTNLERGQYQFKYQASFDGIVWKDGLSVLQVDKHVAFWKTPLFVALAVLVLVLLSWLGYLLRLRRIRAEAKRETLFEKQLAEVEMTALRAQMNPHFIFNALSSIKYFILEKEIDAANIYLTKFSQLIRAVLKNSKSKLVPLADELQALRLYVELEAVRFTEKFEYTIEVDPGIRQDEVVVPPLLIQPYVENAIWHGLLQKAAPGHLWVRIRKQNAHLHIEVQDDGIGREKARELKSKLTTGKKSLGMQITKDRINLIKQSIGIDSTVHVEDLYGNGSPSGTLVVIGIPYLLKEPAPDTE